MSDELEKKEPGLEERFAKAVEVAVAMTGNLDEAVKSGACLSPRFDRTFE